MQPASGASARFDYLDGLRALAILAVICVHWGSQYTSLGSGGFIGVDVFFVLSGFVITTVLWRSRHDGGSLGAAWSAFIVRRARRLLPALVGLCVLGPLLWAITPGTPLPLGTVLERAALSVAQVSWAAEMAGTSTDPFRQTWSLGIEWLFYLVWPVVLFVAARRGLAASTIAKGAVVAAVVLYFAPALVLELRAFHFFPLPRFGQILVGGALALWYVDHRPEQVERPRQRLLAGAGLLALAAYVVAGPEPGTELVRLAVLPLVALVTGYLVHHAYADRGGPVHALLSLPLLAGLGRVSYSLYLWHWLPIYLLDKDEIALPTVVLGVIGLTMVTLLTWLSYVLLERPFLRPRGDVLLPARSTSVTG